MLDIGWTELLVIAVILIVVVGPKDLPPMIRAFGKMTSRLRRTAGEFRAQFDEALREAELDDLRKSVDDVRNLNPKNALRDAINPLRQMGNEIKADLQKATTADAKAAAGVTSTEPALAASFPEMPSPLVGVPGELAQSMPDPAPAAKPAKAAAPRKTKVAAAVESPKPAKSPVAAKPAKPGRSKPAAVESETARPATPKKPRKPKTEEPA